MSPTEFSNYIKQRAAMQQQMHHPPTSPGGRSLSPSHHPPGPPDYFFPQSQYHPYSGYPPLPDLYHPKFPPSYLEPGSQFYPPVGPSTPGPGPLQAPQSDKQLLDSINNFGLASYPAGQYQHLLVAN